MEFDTFIAELIAGDQHQGGLRCLQLFTLNNHFMKQLHHEVETYCHTHAASIISEPEHITHWIHSCGDVAQYSLLNRSGQADDFSTDHDLSCKGKWFFDEANYPAIGQLISCWPHLINFRINVLPSQAVLTAHEEHIPFRTINGSIGARLRFHLPIDTNQGAELNLDSYVYHWSPGTIYLFNQGCAHTAKNNGDSPRIHLVWDALLTEKLFHFLFHNHHQIDFLQYNKPIAVRAKRLEDIGSYRRLPPQVKESELSELSLCLPQ